MQIIMWYSLILIKKNCPGGDPRISLDIFGYLKISRSHYISLYLNISQHKHKDIFWDFFPKYLRYMICNVQFGWCFSWLMHVLNADEINWFHIINVTILCDVHHLITFCKCTFVHVFCSLQYNKCPNYIFLL